MVYEVFNIRFIVKAKLEPQLWLFSLNDIG